MIGVQNLRKMHALTILIIFDEMLLLGFLIVNDSWWLNA